ncbi:MAG TPA: transposase [Planctomycetota bacterium]
MRRVYRGDSVWHVFARGARRLALFYEDQDYREFLLFLKEALIVSGCYLYGYCLMTNHYHLIVRGTQAQLSKCMWRLNLRYALFHNDRHRMGGHVFEGPYKRFPQRTLKWLFWKLAYVFLNPVSADMVDAPEDYPWSGFRSFMGREGSPLEVDPLPWMKDLGVDPEDARESFLRILDEQRRFGKKASAGAPTSAMILADQFRWLLRQAEARARAVQGIEASTLALYWGWETGVPPRIMVKQFSGMTVAAARQRVRRFKEDLAEDACLAAMAEL